MLYKLNSSNDKFDELVPTEFKDFSDIKHLEKDLENLISKNLFDVLFEDSRLMPIHQERPYQPEPDIVAMDEKGDLTIFELKRGAAGEDALYQLFRYTQSIASWKYYKLNEKYQQYSKSNSGLVKNHSKDLVEHHSEFFELNEKLEKKEINRNQHLVVIGNAADNTLIRAVDYWKTQGISIRFLPYRIYNLDDKHYFEFFSPPYDSHMNPAHNKGILFDTNRSYDEDAIWDMLENNVVAAFGDARRNIQSIHPGDYVFFSHRWEGIVAAATVENSKIKNPDSETRTRSVKFLTPIPNKGEPLVAMPFSKVSEFLGKTFFWARTIKVPYLSVEEAKHFADYLNKYLEEQRKNKHSND